MAVMRLNICENHAVRDQFIKGVHLLKAERTGDEPGTYDSLVIMHHMAMHMLTPPGRSGGRNAAHSGPVFLPWHRFLLLLLETHLQRVLGDPTFGLPYWDWLTDGQLPADEQRHAALWRDDCLGPLADAVPSGPFGASEWRVNYEGKLSGDLVQVNRGLRRTPSTPFNLPVMEDLVQAMTFEIYDQADWGPTTASFRSAVEGRHPLRPDGMMHNRVHQWI